MSRTGEYHWTFGDGCHISFPNGGDPIAEPPHAFTSREGCAAISDTAGNLLFYTDGVNLYDATNTTPINGAVPLGGHSSSTNSAIVVPPAGGGSLYHLFTVGTWSDATNNNAVLHYTPVAEVSGKVSIPGLGPAQDVIDPTHGNKWLVSESIGATSHVDCDKYWVVCLDANNEEWVSILMASDLGPLPANMIRSAYAAPSLPSNAYGMRISADGKFIAHANAQSPPNVSTIDIFNLDRSSGAVTYHSQISELGGGANPYGLEFSNNSEHLYFTDWARGTIHRHTMGSDATLAQCAPIYDHAGRVGALQLGPNGKIYATKYEQNTLISIDNPNATLTSTRRPSPKHERCRVSVNRASSRRRRPHLHQGRSIRSAYVHPHCR